MKSDCERSATTSEKTLGCGKESAKKPYKIVSIRNWDEVGFEEGFRSVHFPADKQTADPFLFPTPEICSIAAGFKPAVQSQERYIRSVAKGDVLLTLPDTPELKTALQYSKEHLSFLTGCTVGGKSKINRSASAGPTAKMKGDFKKSDILDDIEKLTEYIDLPLNQAVFGCSPKQEVLSAHDVDDRKKLRTFFPSDFNLLFWMKYFFAEQNNRLKTLGSNLKRSYIRYGWRKQFGGFDKLFQNMKEMPIRWCSDISGWDRFFPLLRMVYALRSNYLRVPADKSEKLRETIEAICKHKICTKDGYIYEKEVGNPSGSNNTTEDNCIGHLIISFYLAIKIWQHLFGTLPTYEDIVNNFEFNLFGDDCLNGTKLPVSDEDLNEIVQETYSEFGMTCKFVHISRGDDLSNLEFLGGVPALTGLGRYFPQIRIGKIAFSLLYGSEDPVQTLAKMGAVFDNLFFDERCDAVKLVDFVISEAKRLICDQDFCSDLNLAECNQLLLMSQGRNSLNFKRLRSFIFGLE